MELTQEEKMMLAVKQQIILRTALHNEYKGTRCNLPVLDDACDLTDEEYDAIAEGAHDNLVRSLIEAGGEIRELRRLLQLARGHINFMLYDYKGPSKKLIQNDLLKIAAYLEGDKNNDSKRIT